VKSIPSRIVPDEDIEEISKQGVAEGESHAIANAASRLANKDDGKVAKLRAAGDKRREEQLKGRDIAKRDRTSKEEWGNFKEGEADYGGDYQAMVKRVGQQAKEGPRKTVWDPEKRVYKTVPVNAPKDKKVAEKMLPKSAFAGSNKNKLGSAGQLKGSMKRPAKAGDLVGGIEEVKIKGVDGKACWKGKRYAGKVKKADGTYKDKCVPIGESWEHEMGKFINLLENK
jgi:hypothetical protein